KVLPPVPVMVAAPPPPGDDDDDDDDDDLRLPGEAQPMLIMEAQPMPIMGCEGPPQSLPASSLFSAREWEEEEEAEENDIAGSFVLDEDEEAGDLASEDCALPAAPADKAEPSAADLDLDMFADM
ncbi:unnamed protein product, partial [Symbiodinium natans]